ncbi:MAG TPA: hypothetical protein VI977_01125 [archaeon]|nr:hypothetical protein [archaeon]
MNSKGLFCFFLVISIAGMQAAMHAQALQENEKFEKTRSLSIEIESLDFARTIIEENADFIAEQAMAEEIRNNNQDTESIKQKANEKISAFFEKEKEFLAREKSLQLGFLQNNPSREFLNENSSLLLISYEGFFFLEYSFTGGILKNNFLKAEIESENAKKSLELPISYVQHAVVLK